jgi:hypothetical protein
MIVGLSRSYESPYYGAQLLQAREINYDELNFARIRLHTFLRVNKNRKFEFPDALFPQGTADILLGELAHCGWGYKLVEAERMPDCYEIYPLSQAEQVDIGD